MKKTVLAICLFITVIVQAQEYSFIPRGLKLITTDELMQKGPPSTLDLVFYEDGTKTTLDEVMSKLMSQELSPKMYVNDKGEYKALVLIGDKIGVKLTKKNLNPKIIYNGMPNKLSKLGYSFGNSESDVVIINTQGGPMPDLLTKQFKDLFVNIGKLNAEEVFVINVHQVQTLNPEKFNKKEISFDKIVNYNKESTKILFDIVTYFKSQNKTVYVTGFSVGAFAVADLLSEYGNTADGYLLMVGRLDMPEKFWKIFSEGRSAGFKEDGTEIVIDEYDSTDPLERNLCKIAAGFGHKRYTSLLKNIDLSNVIYIYGKKDQNVGRLTQKEVDFLKSKKVNLIARDAGHEIMQTYLKEAFKLLLK